VVGSPTHPVMPNLVVLWKMSPLRGGVRAGARLWARGPAYRSWAATGPKPKPGGAGGAPAPLRGEARRPAQGLPFSPHNIKGWSFNRPFAASVEPSCRAGAIARALGTTDRLLVHVVKASGNRCLSGTGFSNCRIVRVSSPSQR
jgi:hypothetical protein